MKVASRVRAVDRCKDVTLAVRLCSWIVALALMLPAVAEAGQPRFFFSGDGVIELDHAHLGERLSVRYRTASGAYDPQALAAIAHFFRSRDSGEEGEISLRLIELIDFVQDHFHPKRTLLVSGYRSPVLNEELRRSGARVAESSLHTEGIAADLQFDGLNLRKLWNELRQRNIGGVGYYGEQGFLHLDTGRPRFWEPQTSRVDEHLSAGNARVFARTEFDRYPQLDGAVIRLHSVTALPLRIAVAAHAGVASLKLAPADEHGAVSDDCIVFAVPAPAYHLRVVEAAVANKLRAPILFDTCTPRLEATPAQFESNLVEITP